MNLVRATRQAIEQRMSISDFDSILDMMASGGNPSYTGKLVSPRNAMGVSAVWACVNLIADDFATLPLLTYRWMEPGVSRDEARDHYLWPLLTEEANPRMSAWDFKQAMEIWRLLWGNCFAEIEMNGRGQITALWPWRPDRVKVWLQYPDDPRSPVLYSYIPMTLNAKPVTLPADRMLHVRHTSIDGIVGMSPIEVHRQLWGLELAMQEFSGRFYSNGASPRAMLEHPGKLGDKAYESLSKSMVQYQGLSNAHRLMILEEGMKYKEIGMPLTDAQFVESRNLNITDACRIYKIPPHKIQQLDMSTNNNIEQQSIDYVQMTQMPINGNWCGRIHVSLLSPRERETIFCEPDYTHLLLGDHAGRAAWIKAMEGKLSIDEIRLKEGYNPLPKGLGKLPRVTLNTAPIGKEQESRQQFKSTPPETQPSSSNGKTEPDVKPNGKDKPKPGNDKGAQ